MQDSYKDKRYLYMHAFVFLDWQKLLLFSRKHVLHIDAAEKISWIINIVYIKVYTEENSKNK